MLLLFARSIPSIGRQSGLVEMPNVSDNEISMIAKKMMFLQDARNPVAHRQTMIQTPALHEVRTEAYSVLIQLGKSFF